MYGIYEVAGSCWKGGKAFNNAPEAHNSELLYVNMFIHIISLLRTSYGSFSVTSTTEAN